MRVPPPGHGTGLGYSSGYGLIADGQGTVIEFIGTARDGLASGTGAMIMRPAGAEETRYYEGRFEHGLPHGVVWVEEPGREPRVRTFRAGKDAGAADADQLQRLSF